jgi:ParB-like chromosome segregation protein Spo0J
MSQVHYEAGDLPVVLAAIDSLRPGLSPRLAGQSEENIRVLMEQDGPLPPILVHRPTNRVIDGMHRLTAARRRGQHAIAVRYVDGDEASAFVLAVRANAAHGLALQLGDRKAAAARILASHPHWSDRRIALVTGLSDKTVAAQRAGTDPRGDAGPQVRIGGDGRAQPVDAGARRLEIARVLAEEPSASLRQVAARVGVSPETVRTVKARISAATLPDASRPVQTPQAAAGSVAGPQRCLNALNRDPSLRSTDVGRRLLRILNTAPTLDREADRLLACVPDHGLDSLAQVALAHAETWRRLAESATRRATPPDDPTAR